MANNPKVINGRLVNKHGTHSDWAAATNFVPLQGELIVYEADNEGHGISRVKIGDGTTKVNDLPFASAPIIDVT